MMRWWRSLSNRCPSAGQLTAGSHSQVQQCSQVSDLRLHATPTSMAVRANLVSSGFRILLSKFSDVGFVHTRASQSTVLPAIIEEEQSVHVWTGLAELF